MVADTITSSARCAARAHVGPSVASSPSRRITISSSIGVDRNARLIRVAGASAATVRGACPAAEICAIRKRFQYLRVLNRTLTSSALLNYLSNDVPPGLAHGDRPVEGR